MYELKAGTKRLAGALYAIAEDKTTVERLAHYLNYRPGQLKEDIAALSDYIRQAEQRAADDSN